MYTSEKLHFKIGLAGTYWDKKPIYSILVNDAIIETREIESPTGEVFFAEFDIEVPEGPNPLKIRLDVFRIIFWRPMICSARYWLLWVARRRR